MQGAGQAGAGFGDVTWVGFAGEPSGAYLHAWEAGSGRGADAGLHDGERLGAGQELHRAGEVDRAAMHRKSPNAGGDWASLSRNRLAQTWGADLRQWGQPSTTQETQ
jgi:hypothetical protein